MKQLSPGIKSGFASSATISNLVLRRIGPVLCSAIAIAQVAIVPSVVAQPTRETFPRELAVDGDARVVVPADSVLVTLLVEETGKSAAEAALAADTKVDRISKAVSALPFGAIASVRGSQLQSAGTPTAGLSGTSAMRASRLLAFRTSQTQRAGEIVDVALSNGAQKALYVDYSVEDAAEAQLQAMKAATDKARKKAELLAQSLGVKLGKLLSAAVAENPEGAAIREQMRLGRDMAQFTEREIHAIANLRFEVE